jgi:hypothetical protein
LAPPQFRLRTGSGFHPQNQRNAFETRSVDIRRKRRT